MGFDHIKDKLDAEGVSLPVPESLHTRTCKRCGQPWYKSEMVNVGEEKWYCKLCYDRPYGEDRHRRGDFNG